MRKLCLLTGFALITCFSASVQGQLAQGRLVRGQAPGQFPGGVPIRQVAYETAAPVFEPEVGVSIHDEGMTYYDGASETEFMEAFDPTALPADCGYSCPPAWSAEVEAFYMNREGDDRFSLSTAFVLNDFDYEPGVRVSVHRHLDCLDGWDVTYAGGFNWIEQRQVNGAGLNSVLGVVAPVVDISTFNNATLHNQSLQSELHSIELTRKWYGWDVFAVGLGVRYLNVEEEYFFGTVGGGGLGTFDVETNNHLGGAQLSLELKIPINRWTTTTRIKGGLFANAADERMTLVNAGATQFANSDDDLEFSALVEFGYFLRYRVSDNVSLTGGYEFWWLYGLALAPDQVPQFLSSRSGLNIDSNGDTWYHGGTFGVEVVY